MRDSQRRGRDGITNALGPQTAGVQTPATLFSSCHLGQVTLILCALVFPAVKWGCNDVDHISTVVMINELIFIKHFSVWPMVKYHVSVHWYLPRVRHSARRGRFFWIALKILQTMSHYLRFAVMLCDLSKIILLISSGGEALPKSPAPQPGPFCKRWNINNFICWIWNSVTLLYSVLWAKYPEPNTLTSFTVWASCKLRVYLNSRECWKA